MAVFTWHQGAQGAEHRPPGVQQLQLEVAIEIALLHRQPGSAASHERSAYKRGRGVADSRPGRVRLA